jgi:2,4-dienoyl-CoA reductase-like NADH-dependent reductase (Old Yellow Enzyme family)
LVIALRSSQERVTCLCSYTPEAAEARLAEGDADLIAFGRLYLGNPDLPERVANGWPLAEGPSREYYYAPGKNPPALGYIMPKYTPSA